MFDGVYLHPLTLVSGPQAVEGSAVRLGGSMAYAREFAVVLRGTDGAVAERDALLEEDFLADEQVRNS